jgi:cytidine kinase
MSTQPSKIIIGGTIAIDHVKTPEAEAQNLLGGSAAYAALAASFFTQPVDLVGIIGHDFPKEHLDMLESRGVTLTGVERSKNESFTWSGEYHANMNERTTHNVGLNVLESWNVKIQPEISAAPIVVLANMSPDNQLQMLGQCTHSNPFVIADTMDLWISIANDRLHEVLPKLDIFVLNEGEARELAGTSNLIKAGQLLLAKGPKNVVVKLGEFGAILFSSECGMRNAERGTAEKVGTQNAERGTAEKVGTRNAECGMKDSSSSTSSIPTSEFPLPSSSPTSEFRLPSSSPSSIPSSEFRLPSSSPSSIPHSALPVPHSSLFRCSAYPLETLADPTGAGDTFLGGMAGYLASQGSAPYDNATLRQAIIQGSILASFTCEAFSTRRLETLTPAELQARLQEFRHLTAW